MGNDETICLGECTSFCTTTTQFTASNTYVVEPVAFELVAH